MITQLISDSDLFWSATACVALFEQDALIEDAHESRRGSKVTCETKKAGSGPAPPEVACRCTVRFFQDIQVKESMPKGFHRILKKVLVGGELRGSMAGHVKTGTPTNRFQEPAFRKA